MPASMLRIAMMSIVLCSANALHAQTCSFNTPPGGVTFTLDPSSPSTQTAFTTLQVKCVSASGAPTPAFTVSGLYGNAPLRMKHTVQTSFIPYSVAFSRRSVSGSSQEWRLTATVLGVDYVNAFAGSYNDSLIVNMTP
jgi:hypothetical protein